MPKILQIVQEPNKVLRKVADEVPISNIKNRELQRLIVDMKETLKHTPSGVGLAASQVGKSLKIFLVSEEAEEIDRAEKSGWKRRREDLPEIKNEKPYKEKEWKYYVFINPVVKNMSKKKSEDNEGCLSVQGKFGSVRRHQKLTVQAYDETGRRFTRGASNFFARVIQHELDHLSGILFIDKAEGISQSEK